MRRMPLHLRTQSKPVTPPMNMPTFAWQASNFLLAFWWGLLTTVGFFVVPLLFAYLDTTQAAGRMAAILFRTQDYVAWVCAGFLIIFYLLNWPASQWNAAQAATFLIAFSVVTSATSRLRL